MKPNELTWPMKNINEYYLSALDSNTSNHLTVCKQGGARGVMVIVAGYGHGDTSSNPEPDWLYFT